MIMVIIVDKQVSLVVDRKRKRRYLAPVSKYHPLVQDTFSFTPILMESPYFIRDYFFNFGNHEVSIKFPGSYSLDSKRLCPIS